MSKKTVSKPVNNRTDAMPSRTTPKSAPKSAASKGTTKEAFDREMSRMKELLIEAESTAKDIADELEATKQEHSLTEKALEDEIRELKEINAKLEKRADDANEERSAAEEVLAEVRQVSDERIAEMSDRCKRQAKALAEKQISLSDAAEDIRVLETRISHLRTGSAIIVVIAAILLAISLSL